MTDADENTIRFIVPPISTIKGNEALENMLIFLKRIFNFIGWKMVSYPGPGATMHIMNSGGWDFIVDPKIT